MPPRDSLASRQERWEALTAQGFAGGDAQAALNPGVTTPGTATMAVEQDRPRRAGSAHHLFFCERTSDEGERRFPRRFRTGHKPRVRGTRHGWGGDARFVRRLRGTGASPRPPLYATETSRVRQRRTTESCRQRRQSRRMCRAHRSWSCEGTPAVRHGRMPGKFTALGPPAWHSKQRTGRARGGQGWAPPTVFLWDKRIGSRAETRRQT